MKSRTLKCLAASIALLLFASNSLFAYTLETNFWTDRKKAQTEPRENREIMEMASLPTDLKIFSSPVTSSFKSSLVKQLPSSISMARKAQYGAILEALPANAGTVRNIITPKGHFSGKTIVHIQDVHLNREAQDNIGRTVEKLGRTGQVDLVALEGTFGRVPLEPYRAFSDKDIVGKVANYLIKNNKISGAVLAGMTSENPFPAFIGIDDRAHYQANIEAYKKSAPRTDRLKKEIQKSEKDLEAQKKSAFNPALAAFDDEVQQFRQNNIELGSHVQFLSKNQPDVSTPLEIFLEALNAEKTLNLSQVEKERAHIIGQLLKTLKKEQVSELVQYSVAFRLGNIRHGDFFQYLESLCEKTGIHLSKFPAMKAYVQYVLLADNIQPELVLQEVKKLELEGYASLAKTPEEKDLVAQADYLYLAGKLVDFALTPEEWGEYKKTVPSALCQVPGKDMKITRHQEPGTRHFFNLSSFESFYREAEARDQSMTQNLLAAMEERKASVAVLVTGGFHANGMQKRLQEAGAAILSFVPRITKVEEENGTRYLSVFTQEKTPLDKLFEGEKLFVTPNPAAFYGASALLAGGKFASGTLNPLSETEVKGIEPGFIQTVTPGPEGSNTAKVQTIEGTFLTDSNLENVIFKPGVEKRNGTSILAIITSISAVFGFASVSIFGLFDWESLSGIFGVISAIALLLLPFFLIENLDQNVKNRKEKAKIRHSYRPKTSRHKSDISRVNPRMNNGRIRFYSIHLALSISSSILGLSSQPIAAQPIPQNYNQVEHQPASPIHLKNTGRENFPVQSLFPGRSQTSQVSKTQSDDLSWGWIVGSIGAVLALLLLKSNSNADAVRKRTLLKKPISSLRLSQGCLARLKRLEKGTVRELVTYTEAQLRQDGMGGYISEISTALGSMGLRLGMSMSEVKDIENPGFAAAFARNFARLFIPFFLASTLFGCARDSDLPKRTPAEIAALELQERRSQLLKQITTAREAKHDEKVFDLLLEYRKVVSQITDRKKKSESLASVAAILAEVDKSAEARKTIEMIPDPAIKKDAIETVAGILAKRVPEETSETTGVQAEPQKNIPEKKKEESKSATNNVPVNPAPQKTAPEQKTIPAKEVREDKKPADATENYVPISDPREFANKIAQGLLKNANEETGLIPSHFGHPGYENIAYLYDLAHNAIELKLTGHIHEARKITDYLAARLRIPEDTVEKSKNLHGTYGIRMIVDLEEYRVKGLVNALDVRNTSTAGQGSLEYLTTPGPMAWMGLAFLHIDPKEYLTEAIQMGEGLLLMMDEKGGIRDGNRGPNNIHVEPHMDSYALFRALAQITGDQKWKEAEDKTLAWFLNNALDPEKGTIYQGIWDGRPSPPHATDAYTWSIASAHEHLSLDTLKKLIATVEAKSLVNITFTRPDAKTVQVIMSDFTDPSDPEVQAPSQSLFDGIHRGEYHPAGSAEWLAGYILMLQVAAVKSWEAGDKEYAIAAKSKANALLENAAESFHEYEGGRYASYATGQWLATAFNWRTPLWTHPGDGSTSSAWFIFVLLGFNPFDVINGDKLARELEEIPTLPREEALELLRKSVVHPPFIEKGPQDLPKELFTVDQPAWFLNEAGQHGGAWGALNDARKTGDKEIYQEAIVWASSAFDKWGRLAEQENRVKSEEVNGIVKSVWGDEKNNDSTSSVYQTIWRYPLLNEITSAVWVLAQAHFDLGQPEEAEKWLNWLAEYNLGQIHSPQARAYWNPCKSLESGEEEMESLFKKVLRDRGMGSAQPSEVPVEEIKLKSNGDVKFFPDLSSNDDENVQENPSDDTKGMGENAAETPQDKPATLERGNAPISLSSPYLSNPGDNWFGYWARVKEDEAQAYDKSKFILYIVTGGELNALKGGRIQIKHGKGEFGLFLKKEKNAWTFTNDAGQEFKGAKWAWVEFNNQRALGILITRSASKVENPQEFHFQSGQQQNGRRLGNTKNIRDINIYVEAFDSEPSAFAPKADASKKPSVKSHGYRPINPIMVAMMTGVMGMYLAGKKGLKIEAKGPKKYHSMAGNSNQRERNRPKKEKLSRSPSKKHRGHLFSSLLSGGILLTLLENVGYSQDKLSVLAFSSNPEYSTVLGFFLFNWIIVAVCLTLLLFIFAFATHIALGTDPRLERLIQARKESRLGIESPIQVAHSALVMSQETLSVNVPNPYLVWRVTRELNQAWPLIDPHSRAQILTALQEQSARPGISPRCAKIISSFIQSHAPVKTPETGHDAPINVNPDSSGGPSRVVVGNGNLIGKPDRLTAALYPEKYWSEPFKFKWKPRNWGDRNPESPLSPEQQNTFDKALKLLRLKNPNLLDRIYTLGPWKIVELDFVKDSSKKTLISNLGEGKLEVNMRIFDLNYVALAILINHEFNRDEFRALDNDLTFFENLKRDVEENQGFSVEGGFKEAFLEVANSRDRYFSFLKKCHLLQGHERKQVIAAFIIKHEFLNLFKVLNQSKEGLARLSRFINILKILFPSLNIQILSDIRTFWQANLDLPRGMQVTPPLVQFPFLKNLIKAIKSLEDMGEETIGLLNRLAQHTNGKGHANPAQMSTQKEIPPELVKLGGVISEALEMTERGKFDIEKLEIELRELIQVELVGINPKPIDRLYNLTPEEADMVGLEVKKNLERKKRRSLSLQKGRETLLKLEFRQFQTFENIAHVNDLALDVRVQDESDIPEAVETIVAARKAKGIDILYVPVKAGLKEGLKNALLASLTAQNLDPVQFKKIDFLETEGGFYKDQVFDLDVLLQVLGFERARNACIGIQGEYSLKKETWDYYSPAHVRLLVLSELLEGIFKAVEVEHDYLQTIDRILKPSTQA